MNLIMPSCKKATELIEKKENFKISPVESVQLFIHASMCNICKGYEKQSRFLKNALENFFNENGKKNTNISVPKDLKAGILEKIEKEV